MAYFETDPVAKIVFLTNRQSSEKTTLTGINATLGSADSICTGIASLMAIGGNVPELEEAKRTVTDVVYGY